MQALTAGIAHVKALGKAAYLFSSDDSKVAHLNLLPKAEVSKAFNAKDWLASVSAVIGGKVGLQSLL